MSKTAKRKPWTRGYVDDRCATTRLAALGPWTTLMDKRWTGFACPRACPQGLPTGFPGFIHIPTGPYQVSLRNTTLTPSRLRRCQQNRTQGAYFGSPVSQRAYAVLLAKASNAGFSQALWFSAARGYFAGDQDRKSELPLVYQKRSPRGRSVFAFVFACPLLL